MDKTDASISLELDSRGKKLCNVVELRVNSSGKTWITWDGKKYGLVCVTAMMVYHVTLLKRDRRELQTN